MVEKSFKWKNKWEFKRNSRASWTSLVLDWRWRWISWTRTGPHEYIDFYKELIQYWKTLISNWQIEFKFEITCIIDLFEVRQYIYLKEGKIERAKEFANKNKCGEIGVWRESYIIQYHTIHIIISQIKKVMYLIKEKAQS